MFANEENQRRKFKRRKRRRTNEKMKTIIKNIEQEIETQLEANNERDDFVTNNIEPILKEVIMDEDIKEMVRRTILRGDSESPYEPKLTRAKIRELLKVRPELSLPMVWPITAKKETNFVSECLSLINENYSENSSEDEEYIPDEEHENLNDPSSSSTFNGLQNTSMGSTSDAVSSYSKDNSYSFFPVQEENIGQRTRSKLPLTDTPLEVIEQAFEPPDITADMYDLECDNEDWFDFIQNFHKPLDKTKGNEPTDNDDDLDDPEYNITNDVETVDKEELRKDRGVDVPQEEVRDLIAELWRECAPSIVGDMRSNKEASQPQSEDPNSFNLLNTNEAPLPHSFDVLSTNQIPPLINNATTETACSNQNPVTINDPNPEHKEIPKLLPAQCRLLKQQLAQHVQILTQNFLQFHKHPIYYGYADVMKTLLFSIDNLSGDNQHSYFSTVNLKSAVRVVNQWEKSRAKVPEPKLNIFERFSKRRKPQIECFSKDLMKTVTMSDVFLYPLLLPHVPFSSSIQVVKYKTSMIESEECLLAYGLEAFMGYVKPKNGTKNQDELLKEAISLITSHLLPCFTKKFILQYIKKKRADSKPNPIKRYFEKGKAPSLTHYVIPVVLQPLFKQPSNLLPDVWAEYVEKNYLVVKIK
ncbi:GON-4-like protein [Planococcus citri]|uniref:GON-4-like protein n=1 Tax=Planococcus citri TaxID=170843 RepID=UPI0031F86D1B